MADKYYLGFAPCGCMKAIIVDVNTPERKRDTAKEIAKWIRAGLSIQHADTFDREKILNNCPACERK